MIDRFFPSSDKNRMSFWKEFSLLTEPKLQGYLAVTVEWWSGVLVLASSRSWAEREDRI